MDHSIADHKSSSPSANNFCTAINLLWQVTEILSSSQNDPSSSVAASHSNSRRREHNLPALHRIALQIGMQLSWQISKTFFTICSIYWVIAFSCTKNVTSTKAWGSTKFLSTNPRRRGPTIFYVLLTFPESFSYNCCLGQK